MFCELTIRKTEQNKKQTTNQPNKGYHAQQVKRSAKTPINTIFWACAADAQHNLIMLYQRHISS